MTDQKTPLVVGVAGGSGSGKTTLAHLILDRIGRDRISFLPHDAYYRKQDHIPFTERVKVNYDHPDSLESELLIEHIRALKEGKSIQLPIYDFAEHTRLSETILIKPCSIILVEGILIFFERELCKMFDVKIFVDADSDIRLVRRINRDVAERGRSVDSVINQYMTTVRPMHLEFVEPSKRYADIIIPVGGLNSVAFDLVIARLETLVGSDNSDGTA